MAIIPIEYNAICPVCGSLESYETKNEDESKKLECTRCGFTEIADKNGKRRIINLGKKIAKRFNVTVSFMTEADSEKELIIFINENVKIEDKEIIYKEEK